MTLLNLAMVVFLQASNSADMSIGLLETWIYLQFILNFLWLIELISDLLIIGIKALKTELFT